MKRRTCTRCKIEMMTNAEEEPYFCIECKEEIEQGKHDEDLIHIGQASRQAEIIEMIDKEIEYRKRLFKNKESESCVHIALKSLKQQILEEKKWHLIH